MLQFCVTNTLFDIILYCIILYYIILYYGSAFARLISLGVSVKQLNVQYRMPDKLCRILSDLFYNGQLLTGIEKVQDDLQLAPIKERVRWINNNTPPPHI